MTDSLADRTFSFAPAGATPPGSPMAARGLKPRAVSDCQYPGGEVLLPSSPLAPSQRQMFRPVSLSSSAFKERFVCAGYGVGGMESGGGIL